MSWLKELLHVGEKKDLERAALLHQRGDQLAGEGSLNDAAKAYEESIKLGESDHAVYIKLAETYFDAYQPQEARDTLRRLVDAAPDDGETYRNLIKICLRKDDQWSLLETIERGLALETKDANYYLVKSYVAQFKYMRDSTAGQPFLEETIEAAEKGIELDPTNADAYYLLARGLSWKYSGAFDSKDPGTEQYDEVIRALEKGLELDPNSAHAESFLGRTYFSAKRYEDAISSCKRRLKLNPADNYPQFLIAASYARLGRFQETIDAMRQALKSQEGARLSAGAHESSIEALKLVAESDTNLARVRSACLFASYASGLFSRTAYKWDSPSQGDQASRDCLHWYEKAHTYLAHLPNSVEWQVHYCAGGEYLRTHRYVEARDALLKSVELHPNTYQVYEVSNHKYHGSPLELLSDCYVQMGLSHQARDAQQRHVEMIRRTGEKIREQIKALEAQPPGSYAPWRLSSLSAFHKWCAEYEAEATRKLSML